MKYKETVGCAILEIEGTSDEIIKVLKYIDSDNKEETEYNICHGNEKECKKCDLPYCNNRKETESHADRIRKALKINK